ncbi:sugar phosphate nucleotidyltransferase [Candidatus Pelagibacter bacterium]|nr:sugar phosphate nucleotidyltransferase [Candidatus Pelagibacter bacterium]MDB2709357.1 sugar phosphate nucleotidyltransferase [Candidatus Pelagibacter bacterium]
MKTIILAGGKGLRISEETRIKPKPMIEIAGLTLLEHIMNVYKSYGFNEFIICGGYKFKILKKYFDKKNKFKSVKVVDTGVNTETGERLLKIKKYLNNDENFFLTYGDGLSNINIKKLLKFHKDKKKIATMTVVKKAMNFGAVKLSSKKLVKKFEEKPNNQFINGGFFVFTKSIFDLLGKNKSLEFYTLPKLVKINNLAAFEHLQFWQCLDNSKDKKILENHFKGNYEKN